ncbi:MAG: hypothetical protein JRJ64_16700 [Deltaproteobacteria bacterium]|nr:hypothetical protein [Deltaproteobacteria bacterium]
MSSVLYRCGGTTVLIAASISEGVPDWMRGSGKGWLTAEYAMHPRANPERNRRDGRNGRVDGRTTEIQRLVGRARARCRWRDPDGVDNGWDDCDGDRARWGSRQRAG